jgi:hypothetical protein
MVRQAYPQLPPHDASTIPVNDFPSLSISEFLSRYGVPLKDRRDYSKANPPYIIHHLRDNADTCHLAEEQRILSSVHRITYQSLANKHQLQPVLFTTYRQVDVPLKANLLNIANSVLHPLCCQSASPDVELAVLHPLVPADGSSRDKQESRAKSWVLLSLVLEPSFFGALQV